MEIGDRIKQIRGNRSRAEFAEELGIHPQTLYMYEKGKRVVDIFFVQQLCVKFNVSVEWLIFGEGKLQSIREHSYPELEAQLAEKEALLAEKDASINQMKNELIAVQAEALKAYDLAVTAICSAANELPKAAIKVPNNHHGLKKSSKK